MGRSYHSRRTSSTSSGNGLVTIFLAFLAYGVWTNPELINRLVHIARVLVIALIAWLFFSLRRGFRKWRQKHNPKIMLIDSMDGLEFETCVAGILKTQGFSNVRLTEKYDFGADIIAIKGGLKWAVQIKRHSGIIKASAVRQVVTALRLYNCDRAMVISNSTYSLVAQRLAKSNGCVLIDRNKLLSWVESS